MIVISGHPVAQGRPRFYRVGKGVRAVDPEKSRMYKEYASRIMTEQMDEFIEDGPITLHITAYFKCPQSDYRKNNPRTQRKHTKRPDLDNIIKIIMDAGTGVLWKDDSQIQHVVASKFILEQGAEPKVVVNVIRQ